MAAVIIKQKDVKRLGKELLNEMFNFFHDEYILTEFEEMKEVQKEFLENLMLNHINTLHRKFEITDEKRKELIKLIIGKKSFLEELYELITFKKSFLKELYDLIFTKNSFPEELKVNAMKDDGIDTEGIYHTLNSLKLDMEIDEDLYYKTKAFLDIFRVFESGYIYL